MSELINPLLARLPESLRTPVGEAIRDATWIKVRRALAAVERVSEERTTPEISVQILSSFEIASIEGALRLGLGCIPSRPKLRIAPLNTIEQELMNAESAVYAEPALATIVLWRVEEMLPELLRSSRNLSASTVHVGLIDRIKRLAAAYLQRSSAPLFLSTLALPATVTDSPLGGRYSAGLAHGVAAINAAIHELAASDKRIRVLDLNWWAAQEGARHYDPQMDFMAKQPFTVRAALSLGFFIARNIRPILVPRRKVLVVDLDNTLWGGVLGEEGLPRLKLGHDFPGNVFLRIQREILELKEQGVLLVLASKNDEGLVRQAFDALPNMLLKWEDFVCQKVNFEHKYLNVRQAAIELGLGLDSFAFIDDSDFEREQMKAFNPEVLVINNDGRGLHMLSSLLQTDGFETHHLTDEDLKRHREYELRAARSAPSEGNPEDFLGSLELRAVLDSINHRNLDRVVQMLGKTNQFNVTTRRHRLDDLQRLISMQHAVGLTLTLIDKFGDQGIVGVLLAVPSPQEKVWLVDSFLVSCRALSRGVEDVLWAELLRLASLEGARRIVAEYRPTAKNNLVATLYDRLGLKRTQESDQGVDYVLDPVQPAAFPPWITVQRINHDST